MLGKAGLAADRIGSNIDHLCDMVLLQATDDILRRTLPELWFLWIQPASYSPQGTKQLP
jgi:hypothetical protein